VSQQADHRLLRGSLHATVEVWRDREYRSFYLALVVFGIASSAGWPLVATFLVDDLHASPAAATWFFATGFLSPLIGIAMGRYSDRTGRHLSLVMTATLWVGLGWAALAAAPALWLALIIGVVFFGARGTLMAQLFAALATRMTARSDPRTSVTSNTVRGGYSLGYVLGPLIGAAIAASAGDRIAFVVTAAMTLATAIPLLGLRSNPPTRDDIRAATRPGRPLKRQLLRQHVGLAVFTLVVLLVSAGDAMKLSFLPLLVEKGLHQGPWVVASLFSVSALVEIVLMPVAGIVAQHIGVARTVVVALGIGTCDYTLLGLSNHLWELYIVQVLHVSVICGVFGLGIVYAQELLPNQPGLATSTFGAGLSLSSPIGSAAGSILVLLVGYPHLFLAPAVACLVGAVTIATMAHQGHQTAQPVA
jgi:SET family sugar efflux transporter-like MFS transporter